MNTRSASHTEVEISLWRSLVVSSHFGWLFRLWESGYLTARGAFRSHLSYGAVSSYALHIASRNESIKFMYYTLNFSRNLEYSTKIAKKIFSNADFSRAG